MPQLTDMLKRVSIGGSKNNLAAAIISASPIRGKSNGNAASANSSPMRRKISLPLEGLDEEAVAAFTCPELHREVFEPISRLAKSLAEVLANDGARSHFCSYLEARDAVNLVKFWQEVKGFKYGRANQGPTPPVSPMSDIVDAADSSCNAGSSSSVFSPTPSAPESPAAAANDDRLKVRNSSDSFDSGYHPSASTPSSNGASAAAGSNRTEDAVALYQRFVAPDCPEPVLLSTETTHAIVQGICTDSGAVDERCFDAAVAQILKSLEAEYFRDFLRSECYAKYQVDVLTSGGPVQMSGVLYNDALLFNFMEFVEEQEDAGCDRDMLEFWLAANNFRERSTAEHVQEDALIIYQRFVSLEATSPLGLSAPLRSRVEESICSRDGVVTPTCFDPAMVLVARVLQQRYLAKFLNSNLYRKYLSDLFSQIQTGPYKSGASGGGGGGAGSSRKVSRRGFGLRRSGSNTSLSTCSSSEVSGAISTQNTLLAMSRSKSTILSPSSTANPEDDPDSIWRRRPSGTSGLDPADPTSLAGNIGHIDRLGRYRSHFDHAPPDGSGGVGGGLGGGGGGGGSAVSDMKSTAAAFVGSKLPKAMKRLVSNNMDVVQEELAWQMAERIVKDVCDVTMSPSSSSSTASGK